MNSDLNKENQLRLWGRRVPVLRVVIVILLLHWASLSYIAVGNSPNCDEVGHLTAGLAAWEFGTFHLYRVNPPLVRLVAALPAYFGSPTTDWMKLVDGPLQRPEWQIGIDFIEANGLDAYWYFTAGRLLCILFTVLGGWYIFLWGRRLYGASSGVAALVMWCISPTVLGWGCTFTPDAASATFLLAATFHTQTWFETGTWKAALIAAMMIAIGELTKFTLIILYPLVPFLWIIGRRFKVVQATGAQLLFVIVAALYFINAGYGFEGSFTKFGDFEFVSQTLSGVDVVENGEVGGNRFEGTLLGEIPVPFPRNYVRGIDLQKVDFEQGKISFLLGEWSERGWWYYYIVALGVKVPLGILMLTLLAVAISFFHGNKTFRFIDLVLYLPCLCVFFAVSSQTGFSRYIRYMLPFLPAMFIFAGQLWRVQNSRIRMLANLLLTWALVSSLMDYPHNLSYFNELAGGRAGGCRVLRDANVDWGQDMLRVKKWVDGHPQARPLFVVHMGFVKASHVDVESQWPVIWSGNATAAQRFRSTEISEPEPAPGWYLISNAELHGMGSSYRYLNELTPVDQIGGSYFVYHIESD